MNLDKKEWINPFDNKKQAIYGYAKINNMFMIKKSDFIQMNVFLKLFKNVKKIYIHYDSEWYR